MKGSNFNDESNSRSSKSKVDGFGKFSKLIKKKKNLQRLGGRGLSLEAFANAKTRSNGYNPALIKKKREFYKNAKYVSKYKKRVKQQTQQNDSHLSMEPTEDKNESDRGAKINKKNKKVKKESHKLEDIYVKKCEEKEKLRMEKEAAIKAKKEERERAEAQRKELRQKMFKKTRKGQPVMKYRIEHLLESIQRSSN